MSSILSASIPSAPPVRPNLVADTTRPNELHASPPRDGSAEASARSVTERVPVSPPILLKAGMSMPANLGQDIDTTA